MHRSTFVVSHFIALLAAAVAVPAPAQQGAGFPDDSPLTEPSVPLTYVGGSGRVSIGIDEDGNNQGDAMGVFASNGERAVVAQLWWQNGGAGGVQVDYNWLWGSTAAQLREHPEDVIVAKASFALDQNATRDRKATAAFGLERNDHFVSAYLSAAASGGRDAGELVDEELATLTGVDPVGAYTQLQTTQLITPIEMQPYRAGIGIRAGRYFDPIALRVAAGLDYEHGSDGAHESRLSLAVDKYLGRRGWSAAAQAEHTERSDAFGDGMSDDRIMLMLRYEFGGQGAFAARDSIVGPAWIARALRTPTSGHSRTVSVYRSRKGPRTATTLGPRQYVNRTPIVVDDAATVASNASGFVIDVLANDSDPDGQPLSVSAVSTPAHGTAVIGANRVTYTPASGYAGADSFTYTVSDTGGLNATGTVSITVQASINRPPVARDDTASTAVDTPVTIAVLSNDTDPDGDPLTVTSVMPPTSGTAQVTAEGRIVYSPSPGFNGNDRFDYAISDGRGGTDVATVFVVVSTSTTPNTPPIAIDDAVTATAGTPITIAVLANDSDADGDALGVTSISAPLNGTAVLNANGTVTYTAPAGFAGTDRFDYAIADGRGGTDTATVTIVVTAPGPNTPPVAIDDTANATAGVPTTITLLANDTDADADPLSVAAITTPQSGSAVLNTNGTVTYTAPATFTGTDRFDYTISDGRGGNDTATVTIVVVAPVVNTPPIANNDTAAATAGVPTTITVLANDTDADADPLTVTGVTTPQFGGAVLNGNGTVTYTAPAAFTGTDRFDYTISDGRGGNDTATVTIVVTAPTPTNTPPVANDDTVNGPGGTTITIVVLSNDTDADGDPLTVTSITPPLVGNAVLNGNGTVSYTSPVGFNGTDRFTYTISDGRGGTDTAQVTIVVLGANVPPIARDDAATVTSPLPPAVNTIDIDVLLNDTDANNDPLTVVAIDPPTIGNTTILPSGQIRYTLATPFIGTVQFFYTISDGHGGNATARVLVQVTPGA